MFLVEPEEMIVRFQLLWLILLTVLGNILVRLCLRMERKENGINILYMIRTHWYTMVRFICIINLILADKPLKFVCKDLLLVIILWDHLKTST